jgi:para-nitrobenzyl esterase
MWWLRALAGVAAALILARGTAAAAPDQALVATGALQGVVEGKVASFKGIPFAAPPVGDLRWRAPQPAASWSGVRAAMAFGPACIQSVGGGGYRGPDSEDCLTLNVWTPVQHAGAKLPVMVWIHGGGFVAGTGARYDGTHFAEDGVVLVTLNYRLGRFGFFAHPALAATNPEGDLADFGFEDQIAALKWVQANIAAFGGDPANVTVFGESAGAVSVNFLLVSPLARGLFAKAISESGFARTDGATLTDARSAGAKFVGALGITGADAAAAGAMRALPARALAPAIRSVVDTDNPGPIIDGVVVAESPAAGFATLHQLAVPLLVGGNSYEASLLPDVYTHPDLVLSRLGDHKDGAVRLFGGGDPAKAAIDIITLSRVIEPDRFEARQMIKAGAPAFVYYFSYVPAGLRAATPGAGHGAEIPYVFETLPKTDLDLPASANRAALHIPAATPADEAVSRAMHAYWVAFAKIGQPGAAGGPAWPAASTEGEPVMEFGADGVNLRPRFEQLKLDLLAARADHGGD